MLTRLPDLYIVLIINYGLAAIFCSGAIFSLLLNWSLREPLGQHLLSSGIIAVVSFSLAAIILMEVLPPLRWSNSEPEDLRTAL